ncbi:ABC-2 transporter permease [Undibacterium griseum]|uniref:ABC-2 type transport system permease protein n=1 Tax=Undibacterium griseum TaxID=2762295 RepID=A0ABR6YKG5_9BURK|nr:hypothetical protein [Undibacterium griseum]MBC3884396.1 hypothetical protein [Undibacterium griseum]
MNTLKWLLKREFWENRSLLLWPNLLVSAVMILFSLIAVFKNLHEDRYAVILHHGVPLSEVQFSDMTSRVAGGSGLLMLGFFMLAMVLTMYSYLSGALSDERKDRSILFWKSMPVSDAATVLSKAIFGVVVFPVTMIVFAFSSNLICLLIICTSYALNGVNLFVPVLFHHDAWQPVYLAIFNFPIYLAWSVLTVGWLLLVSSSLNKRVGLWVVLGPVGVFFFFVWMSSQFGLDWNVRHFGYFVVGRLIFSLIPCGWLFSNEIAQQYLLIQGQKEKIEWLFQIMRDPQWQLFAHWNIWVGMIVGAGMILAAIKIRRWRE